MPCCFPILLCPALTTQASSRALPSEALPKGGEGMNSGDQPCTHGRRGCHPTTAEPACAGTSTYYATLYTQPQAASCRDAW